MIPHMDLADPTRNRTPMAGLVDLTMLRVLTDQAIRKALDIHLATNRVLMSPAAGRDPELPRQNSATLATGE